MRKKLMALLIAVAMTVGMCIPAFAAQQGTLGNGAITINDAVKGQNYSVYQILYLESYSDEDGDGEDAEDAYSYKANSAWERWLKTQTQYVVVDDQGYVTWIAEGDDAAKEFAAAARAYAKANPETIKADFTKKATSTTVTFGELKLGYYLVESTLGVLCSLDTTNPTVVMEEKNSIPDITKQVQENSKVTDPGEGWGATNDASIGDTVNFRSVIKAQPNSLDYVMHDKMSAGLTLDADSIAVEGLTEGTDYTVVTEGLCADCDFHIVFAQSYLDSLTTETDIVVTYSAVLNVDAVVAGEGNPNDVKLVYGDESETEWRRTVTYTWGMGILKYANGDESKKLADAKFVLLNAAGDKVALFDAAGKVTSWVAVSTLEVVNEEIQWPEAAVLVTGEDGQISVEGLDAGNFSLREIAAPAGYNKLSEDVNVVVEAGKISEGVVLEYEPTIVGVNNQSGTELPSTGGFGTKVLYAAGAVLVIGAAVLLVVRRRASGIE